MISVTEAKQLILKNTQDFGTEEIPFLESVGRVLKEAIFADRDFPPFNRVSMDGIAINFKFFDQGSRTFKIVGIQAAGSKQATMSNANDCYEVMTGAVLPNNCDTVIRYEDLEITNNNATILIDKINENQNVHPQGKDGKKGDILIRKNTILSSAEIGVLATVGKTFVKVAKLPKVMIVSTGDELVGVDQTPETHQIRRSNVFTLVSLLQELKIPAETAHITDNKEILEEKIAAYLQKYDVLLFSGAVSKGKYDFLPEVLESLNVEKSFHKVAQRPGKPFWFGIADAFIMSERYEDEYVKSINNKTVVFAFPGNPISTYVNCLVYFYDWYKKSVGIEPIDTKAILAEDVDFRPTLTYFLQVKLVNENGVLKAYPIKGNGSGDLASLVHTDGFIQLPKTKELTFKKGKEFPVILYR